MSAEITLSELKKHNNKKSLWIAINNHVYDVTKFLEEHPGGEEALLDFAGKDGTQAFEEVGHSEDARELLKKFKVGSLPPGETSKPVAKDCSGGNLKWALLALASAVVIGVVLKKYMG